MVSFIHTMMFVVLERLIFYDGDISVLLSSLEKVKFEQGHPL